MNVSVVLPVEIVTLLVLSVLLHSGPAKLIALASVVACASFHLAMNVSLPSVVGLLLFSSWLVGSIGQFGSVIIVWIKPGCSQYHEVTVMCLIAANCANDWFMYRYFDAVV